MICLNDFPIFDQRFNVAQRATEIAARPVAQKAPVKPGAAVADQRDDPRANSHGKRSSKLEILRPGSQRYKDCL